MGGSSFILFVVPVEPYTARAEQTGRLMDIQTPGSGDHSAQCSTVFLFYFIDLSLFFAFKDTFFCQTNFSSLQLCAEFCMHVHQ